MNGRPYSEDELKTILHLYYNKNNTLKQVAAATGRSVKAIQNTVHRNKDMVPDKNYVIPILTSVENKGKIESLLARSSSPVEQKPAVEQPKQVQLSPREMIKHLYSLGYRIKNNELVVLVEQKVNIKDIING